MKHCTAPHAALFHVCLVASTPPQHIHIRAATLHDMPALLQVDRKVSYEFFKPLYQKDFAHLPIGQNPDYYLEQELAYDIEWFTACIENTAQDCLIIAYDVHADTIAGFIVVQPHASELHIKLLLVDNAYRRQGIGKTLVLSALHSFSTYSVCIVYPFSSPSNEPARRFYQSLGFVDCGPCPLPGCNGYGVPYQDMYRHYKRYDS